MQRCLQIAKNANAIALPNPAVGAVIVCDSEIIGEGFTSSFGGNHAEINALKSVKNQSLLQKSTLYVTLEPCAHFGKTPPCANAIVNKGIQKVVIGCLDPNLKVAGKGVQILKDAKIEVIVGVLEDDCITHHQKFLIPQIKNRPFITLKWAQSVDGFIAPKNQDNGQPFWISNVFSRQITHKLRAENQAILVGTTTVLKDNPSLTTREWFGKNATKVVLDKNLKLDNNLHVFDNQSNAIIITSLENKKSKPENENLTHLFIDFNSSNIAQQICEVLYAHKIESFIVEGGLQTLQTFIDSNLWDKAFVFQSDLKIENGVKAPIFLGNLLSEITIKNDFLRIYSND